MILGGDCLDRLKELDANSVDSVVTDPPYGLKFMGKKWDHSVPSVEMWREVFRVLKPGGHILAFGGTRTYHRLVVNIEDAGFEIRDQVQWIYGSGFPKSHNLKGDWSGYGTALKPACEPICLARKPLEGTVAQNVMKHSVGALNIDASRIEFASEKDLKSATFGSQPKITSKNVGNEGGSFQGYAQGVNATNIEANPQGRWPANVLFDEDAALVLDEQSGVGKSPKGPITQGGGQNSFAPSAEYIKKRNTKFQGHGDTGGASRFFYVAKASKRERNAGLDVANHHPTVKPIKLMQYLITLITPPGGVVLDPFAGSGSTLVAAKLLGFEFIGIELDPEYVEIGRKRLEAVV